MLISPPGMDDKDAAVFPKKIGGKYVFLHRLGSEIWIDRVDDLKFKDGKFLGGEVLMRPRDTAWDSKRIGISAPPIETKYGWLLLYHGISKRTGHYNVRAALLDLKDPVKDPVSHARPVARAHACVRKAGDRLERRFPVRCRCAAAPALCLLWRCGQSGGRRVHRCGSAD